MDIVASHAAPNESRWTFSTLVALVQIFTAGSWETGVGFLTLIHRETAIGTTPISPEAAWACATLVLRICQLGALNISKAWGLEVNTRICRENSSAIVIVCAFLFPPQCSLVWVPGSLNHTLYMFVYACQVLGTKPFACNRILIIFLDAPACTTTSISPHCTWTSMNIAVYHFHLVSSAVISPVLC